MKIAIFHHLPDGGAKITLYEQIKRLKKDHKIDLYRFTTDEGEYDISSLCRKTFLFPYEASRSERKSGLSRIGQDIRSFILLKSIHKQIALQIDKNNYDIVLVHASRLTQAPYLLRFLKTPSIYYCQEPLRMVFEYQLRLKKRVGFIKYFYEKLNRFIRKNIDRKNISSATKILTNSNYTKEYIERVYGLDSTVCSPGVDADQFNPGERNKKDGILFIGNKSWVKGYHLLKKALDKIPKSKRPKLILIEPESSGDFMKLKEQVISALRKSQLTACISFFEPFGLVALESMACQTPVIAVNEGGYLETVIDGKTGILVERNAEILSKEILKLTQNPDLCKKMGKAGRLHVKKNFTWEKHIKILEELFQNISQDET